MNVWDYLKNVRDSTVAIVFSGIVGVSHGTLSQIVWEVEVELAEVFVVQIVALISGYLVIRKARRKKRI